MPWWSCAVQGRVNTNNCQGAHMGTSGPSVSTALYAGSRSLMLFGAEASAFRETRSRGTLLGTTLLKGDVAVCWVRLLGTVQKHMTVT